MTIRLATTGIVVWLALFCLVRNPVIAQDGVPAVPYTQVPELKAYIEQGVSNPTPDDATVAKVDLNQPPDGTPEYIVSYHSTLNCGSGGCATEVLRVSPSGKVENIAETLGYGIGIAYTATKGMLDLLTVRKDGKYTLKFDGRQYQPYQGQSKAATTKPKNWKAPKVFAASDPVATPAQWAASKNAARARGILVWDPVEDFPGVKKYLQAQNEGVDLDDTTVAVVELSNPPDSTPEYLVSLDQDSFCGTGGCTLEVLRKRSDGKIESLIAILNFGYSLAYTYTNGMRDILSVSRSGEFIWRFDGKRYKPQKGQPKAATTKPADWKEPLVAGTGPKAPAVAGPKSAGKSQPRQVYRHYSAFPELRAYVEKGAGEHPTDKVIAIKADLNEPPDGVPEYILYLETFNWCGSRSCNTEIVNVLPSGKVEVIDAHLGVKFELAGTSTNGMRDLTTGDSSEKIVWKFDGKNYKSQQDQAEEALTSPQSSQPARTSGPETAADSENRQAGMGGKQTDLASRQNKRPKPYVGPVPRAPGCVGEYGWRRGYERGRVRRGYAVFGHCTDPENMILKLNCRTDRKGVEVELEIDPENTGKVKIAIQVDDAGYLVEANTQYVEMFGYNVPTFRISPRSPLLNALARGQSARFIVANKAVKIHLKGAAKAIGTMRRACRG